MSENRIYQGLISCASECPEQIALEELATGKTIAYGDLLRLVDAGVEFLDSHQYPETVVVLADMGIDVVVVYYAIVCSGRTAAMIDDDIETPHGLLFKTKHPELCIKPTDFVAYLSSFEHGVNEARQIPMANEIESVLFTSGSTGEPKIFGIPGRRPTQARLLPTENPNGYAVLNTRRPSSTPYRVNLDRALVNKGRFVSVDFSEISPSEMDRLLSGRSISETSVTPTMVRGVFPLLKGDWTQTMERLHVNGERVYRDDLEFIFKMMPQVTVRKNYGLTEFGNVSEGLLTAKDLASEHDPISAGVPTKDVEIRQDDSDAEMAIGESGRVCVRGAYGFLGSLTDDGHFTFERFRLMVGRTLVIVVSSTIAKN